jgi:hypothetical protein
MLSVTISNLSDVGRAKDFFTFSTGIVSASVYTFGVFVVFAGFAF